MIEQLERFNKILSESKEVLDIIFTYEGKQQVQVTIPLQSLLSRGAFMDGKSYESELLYINNVICSARPVTEAIDPLPKLVKISTCIISDKIKKPVWWGDWVGKFYYEY